MCFVEVFGGWCGRNHGNAPTSCKFMRSQVSFWGPKKGTNPCF